MNHEIEQEIQDKGLTAPRVTLADIENNIIAEKYFTANDAKNSHTKFNTKNPDYLSIEKSLRLLTFCILILRNGFTVTGESACASPENFNWELGKKIARENAVQNVWMLEGYSLKQKLFEKDI